MGDYHALSMAIEVHEYGTTVVRFEVGERFSIPHFSRKEQKGTFVVSPTPVQSIEAHWLDDKSHAMRVEVTMVGGHVSTYYGYMCSHVAAQEVRFND